MTEDRSKIDPKSNKVNKKTTKNRPRSIKITHERPNAAPRCAQEAPKSEKTTKLVEIEIHFEAEIAPKTAPRPSKSDKKLQRAPKKRFVTFFWYFFTMLVDFWSILGRCSVDFWFIFSLKNNMNFEHVVCGVLGDFCSLFANFLKCPTATMYCK